MKKNCLILFIIIVGSIGIGSFLLDTDISENCYDPIEQWEELDNVTIYGYKYEGDIDTGGSYPDYYPINTQLTVEWSGSIYYVPFQNTSIILKLNCTTRVNSLIVTEGGAITKFYLDRANSKLYYYYEQSKFSYVDLTDDSITDLTPTLNACEEILVYGGDLFAIDTSEDDLTFYIYNAGGPSWDAVGTIAEGATNYYDCSTLSGGLNAQVTDVCFDGTYYYVPDADDASIYRYTSAWVYDTVFDISGDGVTDPTWMCHDGTYYYILEIATANCYKYDASFTLQSTTNLFSGGCGISNPGAICWDGTYFRVRSTTTQMIYAVYPTLTSINSSLTFDYNEDFGIADVDGIAYDETYFYLSADGTLYKFNYDFDILLDTYSIGALGGNDNGQGIEFDGNFFLVADNIDGYVYQYYRTVMELGNISFSAVISDKCYVVYQYIGQAAKIYVKDLDDSSNPSALETLTSDLLIPYLENQRGIATSTDNDTLFFCMKDTGDSKVYLCTYAITADTFTQRGIFNVALMLDRNTNSSNAIPFNLEKAFGVGASNNLSVYQIPGTVTSNVSRRIAKLDNLYKTASTQVSGAIVGITDTYLIIKESDNNTILLKFQDISSYIQNAFFIHAERDYARAQIDYDERYYPLETDMFVQMIGTVKGVADQVKFEGFVHEIEELYPHNPHLSHFKRASIISYAYFDLEWHIPSTTTSSGDPDAYLDDIDDNFVYLQKGTYDDAPDFNTDPDLVGDKNTHRVLDEFGSWSQFTWYHTFTGSLFFEAQSTSSGVTYDQTDCIKIEVGNRKTRINAVTVKGKFDSDGNQVESTEQVDQDLIDEFGKKALEITIAWIEDATDANSMASALLALLKTDLIYCKITVRDTTNGVLQPGETITFSNSYKGISSETYMINQITHNDKTLHTEYVLSNGIRYELADFEEKEDQDLSEQVYQISTYAQGLVSDTAYDATSWNGVTDVAPSKNAVRDKIEDLLLDEDDMASDSDTQGATQQSIKAFTNPIPLHSGVNYLYFGTYTFLFERVGLTGTNIVFVDSETPYDGGCEIQHASDGHLKVLRFQGDATAGQDPIFTHILNQATAKTVEFYIKTNNISARFEMSFMEDATKCTRMRIYDSALDYIDSDSVWQEIQAISNDTWYRITMQWYADNTIDISVNGTLQVDGVAMDNNQSSGINKFQVEENSDNADYLFIDAWGESDDSDYTVGDNANKIYGIVK